MMTSTTGRNLQTRRRKTNAKSGITLLELILVLAILCILTGIIAPRISGFAEGRRFVSEWHHLVDMVRYARSEAIARSVTVKIEFDAENRTYGIVKENSGLKNLPVAFTEHMLPDKLSLEFPDSETQEDNHVTISFLPDGSMDADSPKRLKLIEENGDFYRILAKDPLLGYVTTDDEEEEESEQENDD